MKDHTPTEFGSLLEVTKTITMSSWGWLDKQGNFVLVAGDLEHDEDVVRRYKIYLKKVRKSVKSIPQDEFEDAAYDWLAKLGWIRIVVEFGDHGGVDLEVLGISITNNQMRAIKDYAIMASNRFHWDAFGQSGKDLKSFRRYVGK